METCIRFLNMISVSNISTAVEVYEKNIIFVIRGEKGALKSHAFIKGESITFVFADGTAVIYDIEGKIVYSITNEEEMEIFGFAVAINSEKFSRIPLSNLLKIINENRANSAS